MSKDKDPKYNFNEYSYICRGQYKDGKIMFLFNDAAMDIFRTQNSEEFANAMKSLAPALVATPKGNA